jgi:tRNA pseudouridine38-40 synthase
VKLRLDIAYDGTPFHGFARQPELPTVQGVLEDALSKLAGRVVTTTGAGRTDAGVHALGQVVSVPEVPDDVDLEDLARRLNAMCGPSIAVTSAIRVADDFDARFSARSRAYVYAISDAPIHDPFLVRTVFYARGPLDEDRMNEAAGHVVGQHDFASFGRVEVGATSERTLFQLRVAREGSLLRVHARANAFIQQMVRSLVGTLVHVGAGRLEPDQMPAIITARDRSAAGPVAPPHGLCLVAVEYEDGWSGPV